MTSIDWRKPVCGWCDLEAESREAQRAHALVCPKSPVVARVRQLERLLESAAKLVEAAGFEELARGLRGEE